MGSEMCIRDRPQRAAAARRQPEHILTPPSPAQVYRSTGRAGGLLGRCVAPPGACVAVHYMCTLVSLVAAATRAGASVCSDLPISRIISYMFRLGWGVKASSGVYYYYVLACIESTDTTATRYVGPRTARVPDPASRHALRGDHVTAQVPLRPSRERGRCPAR